MAGSISSGAGVLGPGCYCLLGEPLGSVEDDRIAQHAASRKGSRRANAAAKDAFVPEWQQEVRDDHGKRRFHGAFTGGFSAGYFNTVGSREGWTPTPGFASSRKGGDRGTVIEQTAADFMDDEDRMDFTGGLKMKATSEFDTLGSTERHLAGKAALAEAIDQEQSLLSGDRLADLIIPANDMIGTRLLKQLGWREGFGIGPRKRRRNSDDPHGKGVLYAPEDTPLPSYVMKTNTHGIGYNPLQNAPEFAAAAATTTKQLSKGTASKPAGFGVGVFEDEEDDVYGVDDTEKYDRVLDEDHPTVGPKRGMRKPGDVSNGSVGAGNLSNFVRAELAPTVNVRNYPLPSVPIDYVEKHVFEADDLQALIPRRGLTTDDRGKLLGETPVKAPKRSVFDLMRPEAAAELKAYFEKRQAQRTAHVSDAPIAPATGPVGPLPQVVHVEPKVAMSALKGFLPFVSDQAKQARYVAFCERNAGVPTATPIYPANMSSSERHTEEQEFAHSARLFRPLSFDMAKRFASAATSTIQAPPTVAGGLATLEQYLDGRPKQTASKPEDLLPTEFGRKDAGRRKRGRETTEFFPTRLLCKRFDVPVPYTPDDLKRAEEERDADPTSRSAHLLDDATMNRLLGDATDSGPPSAAKELHGESERVIERPSMDLFKAIFDDSDTEEPAASLSPTSTATTVVPVPTTTPAVTDVAQGSFRPVFNRQRMFNKRRLLESLNVTPTAEKAPSAVVQLTPFTEMSVLGISEPSAAKSTLASTTPVVEDVQNASAETSAFVTSPLVDSTLLKKKKRKREKKEEDEGPKIEKKKKKKDKKDTQDKTSRKKKKKVKDDSSVKELKKKKKSKRVDETQIRPVGADLRTWTEKTPTATALPSDRVVYDEPYEELDQSKKRARHEDSGRTPETLSQQITSSSPNGMPQKRRRSNSHHAAPNLPSHPEKIAASTSPADIDTGEQRPNSGPEKAENEVDSFMQTILHAQIANSKAPEALPVCAGHQTVSPVVVGHSSIPRRRATASEFF